MLSCQNNDAAVDGMFNKCYVFNQIIYDYLKLYHQASLGLEIEEILMLLTSDIPACNLPGLNVKIYGNHCTNE